MVTATQVSVLVDKCQQPPMKNLETSIMSHDYQGSWMGCQVSQFAITGRERTWCDKRFHRWNQKHRLAGWLYKFMKELHQAAGAAKCHGFISPQLQSLDWWFIIKFWCTCKNHYVFSLTRGVVPWNLFYLLAFHQNQKIFQGVETSWWIFTKIYYEFSHAVTSEGDCDGDERVRLVMLIYNVAACSR